MNDRELAELLTRTQAIDPRIGELDRVALESWRDLIGDLDFGDALGAVRAHYRDTASRIMPADIRMRAGRTSREAGGFVVRPGVHCAPGAHLLVPDGTCRLCDAHRDDIAAGVR